MIENVITKMSSQGVRLEQSKKESFSKHLGFIYSIQFTFQFMTIPELNAYKKAAFRKPGELSS